MENHTDIAIVGGGLNGMVMASAACAGGHSVAVFETRPRAVLAKADFDGRAYALSYASVQMLRALGLWDLMQAHAQPILEIKVSDGRAGQGAWGASVLHFDHHELEEGPMGYMLQDRYFRAAMLDWVDSHAQCTVHYDASVITQSVGADKVTVHTQSAKVYSAQLLIGADGRHSPIALRNGLRKHGWDYAQSALVCAIAHERSHHGIAQQFFTPAGPLAILPLQGNHSAIVWTEDKQRAKRLQAGTKVDYLAALRYVVGDYLGRIDLVGQRFSYPLSLSIAQNYVAPRLALIGDAAHGVHPLAGQGLNLGFGDIAALAEVISDAKHRGEDSGDLSVLRRYERWRRFDVQSMGWMTNTINRVFSNDYMGLRLLRGVGLNSLNAIPVLRRGFMRYAAGLRGGQPKLLRGQSLL